MQTCFALLTLLALTLLELWIGNFGLSVPLVGCGIFYFSINGSWRQAVWLAALFGLLLDFNFGRMFFWTPWFLLLVVGFAWLWRKYQTVRPLLINLVPGALISVMMLAIPFGWRWARNHWAAETGIDLLALLVFAALATALWLPINILVFDLFCAQLALPRYLESGMRSDRRER